MRWGKVVGVLVAALATLAGALSLPAIANAGRAVNALGCRTVLCAGVSQDGSRVVFPYEGELIAGAGKRQIYEWHAGKLRALIPGGIPAPQVAVLDGASADMAHVFASTGVPLSPQDIDGSGEDIYDLSGGTASLVSTGPLDPQASSEPAFFAGASPDGQHVFFNAWGRLTSQDLDKCPDLYQRFAGVTTLVGPNPEPPPPPICESAAFGGVSGDGSHFFFISGVELEPGDKEGDDIYQQVGPALTRLTTYPEPEWNCVEFVRFVDASSDGGTVLFTTNSAISPEDTDRADDLYKRRPDGTFVLVSRNTPGGEGCGFSDVRGVALSADGHTAIFETSAQLSPADHDSANDLYSADDDGAVELISTGPTDPGVEEPTNVYPDWIADVSDDAKRVAFETRQQLVKGDKDASADVYARADGRTVLISAGPPARPPMKPNAELSGISEDGGRVVFATREPLVAKDTNGERDVYLRRLGSRRPVLLSAETIAPRMSVSRRAARLRSGDLAIRLGCPKAERDGPCHGVVKLAPSRHGKPLGQADFRIAAGKRKRIVVNLRHALPLARHSLIARVQGIDRLGNAKLLVRRVALGG
jgi:hypothetical protein